MEFSSTPTLSEFVPLDTQMRVIQDIRQELDYDLGVHEILLSGSVGSAKTLVLAHIAITHCLENPGAKLGIGRLTMPSLKETLFSVIVCHLGNETRYTENKVVASIKFPNGSEILSFSWADKNYMKIRSYEFSAFIIEELVENKTGDFYEEIFNRVGRLRHVEEKFILNATNPDQPSHWVYKRFMTDKRDTRHVYYSKTHENIHLPVSYVTQLEKNLDEKMARRMLFGEWLSIAQDIVYYSYSDHNFIDEDYAPDPSLPLRISHDFNIGIGKPISAIVFQYVPRTGEFHFFDEIILDGSRTEDVMEDAHGRGLLDHPNKIIIHGDATGKHRDTRGKHSDYDIIKRFLDNTKNSRGQYIKYSIDVPLSNPRLRDRHNITNAQIKNSRGERHVFVYKNAKTLDEGLRLTKLKAGSQYIEDDSFRAQHVTTAMGYGIIATLNAENKKPIRVYSR